MGRLSVWSARGTCSAIMPTTRSRWAREIEAAQSPPELGKVWSGLTTVVRALVNEGVEARNVTAIISRELRGLTQRACQLAEAELAEESGNAPPTHYAMLVLGSGGRGESMLAMDPGQCNCVSGGGSRRRHGTGWLEEAWMSRCRHA